MVNNRVGHLGRWSARVALITMIAGLVLPGLAGPIAQTSAQSSAQDTPRLRVMASFSILADIAANVAGDAADVEALIPRGTNPHSFEPTAQDVVTLSEADVVFVVGLGFEENLIEVVEESAPAMRTVSDCVPVQPVPQGVVHDDHGDHGDHADEHAGEHASETDAHTWEHDADHNAEHACETHHATVTDVFGLEQVAGADTLGLAANGACDDGCDPHVWTEPARAALWALAIRDTLSEYDPANADAYVANAAAYLDELAALHHDISVQIDAIPPENRVVVTNHLAFNYFATRYGLDLVGVVIPGGSTTAEPSVQEVLDLIDAITRTGAPAIFTETTVSDSLAQQIADETGADIVRLYTGSLSPADGPAATYIDYMLYNTGQIAVALQ